MAEGDAGGSRVPVSDGLTWRVDAGRVPGEIIQAGSALMQHEWPPPCLVYDVPYLQWQLGDWGGPPALTVTGWQDGRCVAFAALTPRQARVDGWHGWIAIKSFMTVATSLRGRGIGRVLRQRIVREAADRRMPLLRFGEHATQVHDALAADYQAAGMRLERVMECVPAAMGIPAIEAPDVREGVAGEGPVPAHVLVPARAAAEHTHSAHDPRGRTALVSHDANGEVLVSASVVRSVLRTRDAHVTSVQLERLALSPAATAHALKQLVAAAGRWGYEGGRGIVTVPSIGDASWEMLAAAGFRRMPPRYSAWVAASEGDHALFSARSTRFEIV